MSVSVIVNRLTTYNFAELRHLTFKHISFLHLNQHNSVKICIYFYRFHSCRHVDRVSSTSNQLCSAQVSNTVFSIVIKGMKIRRWTFLWLLHFSLSYSDNKCENKEVFGVVKQAKVIESEALFISICSYPWLQCCPGKQRNNPILLFQLTYFNLDIGEGVEVWSVVDGADVDGDCGGSVPNVGPVNIT